MRLEFDSAQVCLNGHLINSASECNPDMNKKFCTKCGATTQTACSHCSHPIQGSMKIGNKAYGKMGAIPMYCEECGKPYPWTISTQEAAYELIELADNVTTSEKDTVKASMKDLITDSPKTAVAVIKFKQFAVKAGVVIANGMKDILVDVVSESVKKAIWGTS